MGGHYKLHFAQLWQMCERCRNAFKLIRLRFWNVRRWFAYTEEIVFLFLGIPLLEHDSAGHQNSHSRGIGGEPPQECFAELTDAAGYRRVLGYALPGPRIACTLH